MKIYCLLFYENYLFREYELCQVQKRKVNVDRCLCKLLNYRFPVKLLRKIIRT